MLTTVRISRCARMGAATIVVAATLAGCGGGNDESAQAGAQSLQEAMDASARAIDGVRGTRASLESVSTSLQTAGDQTGDVIGVLAAQGNEPADLLTAARQQRTFLQLSQRAAVARTRASAQSILTQARAAGRRAVEAYAATSRADSELAGLLPASTTFNTGRLRDAVLKVNPPKKTKSSSGDKDGKGPTTIVAGNGSSGGGSSCGGGVSVNGNTSCSFAANVAEAVHSGASGSIEVYSPVTGRTYTMHCSEGLPAVCTGGNNARVEVR